MTKRDEIICENFSLVHHIIWRYYPALGDDEDIYQIGCIGLIKAVDTFDIEAGNAFSTYAAKCIRNEIQMDLRKRKRWNAAISLESVVAINDDDELRIGDLLISEDDKSVMSLMDYERLLDQREQIVLRYLLDGKSQGYIAEQIHTSRQNVCRIVRDMRLKWKKGV